jgi:hypothetical protein
VIRAENEGVKRAITIMGDKEIRTACCAGDGHLRTATSPTSHSRCRKAAADGGCTTYLHTPILAWSVSAEDEERFKRILRQVLAVCLVIALVMPWLPVREPDRTAAERCRRGSRAAARSRAATADDDAAET